MSRPTPHRKVAVLLSLALCGSLLAGAVPTATAAAPRKAPDLVVVAPTVDRRSVAEGAQLTVTHRVRNTGSKAAGATHTRYYLTRDVAASLAERRSGTTHPRIALADLRLAGATSVTKVAPRKQSTLRRAKVTVPVGIEAGSYRVLVCADDRGAVKESDEGDNCTVARGALAVSSAPGSTGLRLEQFADTAQWPEDESEALEWIGLFCNATRPVQAFTPSGALASIEAFLRDQAGQGALDDVADSGLADTAGEAQVLAATAVTEDSPGLALAALLRAHRMEPRVGTHLINLAAVAASAGLPNQALGLLDRALVLDTRPTPFGIRPEATALVVRGQALALTGRLAAARSAFSRARVMAPLLSEADAGLAVVEACSGNEALAARYVRKARQRSDDPKKPTETPTTPLPEQPEPALDLSQGVVTNLRQLPLPATPAQGASMHEQFDAIAEGFFAEIDADNAEEDAIRERLRAVDQVITPAERMRREDVTTFAYLVGTNGDRADVLLDEVWDVVDDITELREGFFGGGTGEVEYTYGRLADEARDACVGAPDYEACYWETINSTCRPELSGAHSQWEQLMSEAQNLLDEWMIEISSRMSAYAANLKDPDAHRRIMLQIERQEQNGYAILVQQAQFWTHYENFYEAECVTPLEIEDLPSPGDVAAHASEACGGPLASMKAVAAFGPTKVKVDCEEVKQELSIEAIPLIHAFAEVSYDIRTGKVTVFAGSKFKASVGVVEGGFKSGLYLTSDGRGGIEDVGWRVGPEIKGVSGPVEVGVWKDYQDISFLGAFSTDL